MGYYANGYGCFEVKDTYLIEEKVDEINDEYDAELVLSGFGGKAFILENGIWVEKQGHIVYE